MATQDEILRSSRKEVGRSLIELEQSSILELFEFKFDKNLAPFRFHAGTNGITKNIIYSGNQYQALAVETEGFEANTSGRLPRPKITVSNNELIISSIMRKYSDFRDSRFTRIKVFLKHLDNENFEGNINPFGTANSYMYISKEKFLLSQKLIENSKFIQFELITPFDLETLQTATRAIYGRYCYWQYRGSGCGYKGDLICKEDDGNFTVAPIQKLRNSNLTYPYGTFNNTALNYLWSSNAVAYSAGQIVCIFNEDVSGIKDPPYSFFVCIKSHISSISARPDSLNNQYWEKDNCSKTISACRKRFGNYNSLLNVTNDSKVTNGILPFGGFPGTDTFSYV